MKRQRKPIGSEVKPEVIQDNFIDLFSLAHEHQVQTLAPADKDGNIGDLIPVIIGSSPYLYIKFPTIGWKRVLLS